MIKTIAAPELASLLRNGITARLLGIRCSDRLFLDDAIRAAIHEVQPDATVLGECGDGRKGGYLAGFESLITQFLDLCNTRCPRIISEYEHCLKRLFPTFDSQYFLVPKDLTNAVPYDERTRFYHHEYQNKLLHSLFGFMQAAAAIEDQHTFVVITNGDLLSPTTQSLVRLMSRKGGIDRLSVIICAENHSRLYQTIDTVQLDGPTAEAFAARALNSFPSLTLNEIEQLRYCCEGQFTLLDALLICRKAGVQHFDYFTSKTVIDLYLSKMGRDFRLTKLAEFISEHCTACDPILVRNYEIASKTERSSLHERLHHEAMSTYKQHKGPLRFIHAISQAHDQKVIELLAEPCRIIRCIGLYDTWLDIFSRYFVDEDLQKLGSGEDQISGNFINAAFVLYSIGAGAISVPYLDAFCSRFPDSQFIPTVLYAQSMTYGRYQVPVDLPKAEELAIQNLTVIDERFTSSPDYVYIKVFAENAYAYIKARQGKFSEALALCTGGNTRMAAAYGDIKYRLHQSILIYNTSQVYELINDMPNAETHLRLAISYDPYYGEYQNDLGNLLSRVPNRETDALEAYGKAIEMCPSYYEAYLNRASFLVQLDRHEEAMADLGLVLDIKPAEARAHGLLGTLQLILGNNDEAKVALSRALYYDGETAEILNNLGLAWSTTDHERAVGYYNNAISLNPRKGDAYNNLAVSLFELGRYSKALEAAQSACKVGGDPDFEDTREYIIDHTPSETQNVA